MSKPEIHPRVWTSVEQIERAIAKLVLRRRQVRAVDFAAPSFTPGASELNALTALRETLHDLYGPTSPEFLEMQHVTLYQGSIGPAMHPRAIAQGQERGRLHVADLITGLIQRLEEKKADISAAVTPSPELVLSFLNLHPRIAAVAGELFEDGYDWQAVFEATKALTNYVRERSGRHDLDGFPLMSLVFSRKDPLLAFNDLASQTDEDEQQGMMHLFQGVILGIRNIGGHSFPEGPRQRAVEYLSLISMLAFRVQDARKRAAQKPAAAP